ncbi:phage Gp37/Gp68 family protein [Methylorubrum extorquens]|uniref:phage Gp37/Gp68 family protein n=1 Tax=Methylorubrum extorquens TaxID=408 RepID=UPI003F5F278B
MAGNSKIEWTEATWNPIVGCSIVSPGCTNCYAMKMAGRLDAMGQPRYVGLTKPSKAGAVWTGEMRLVEEALTIPLRRKKPTTWFVNSMSDLFHESVPDAWIDRVFAVMALCPQHTFQVLTKRSARMRDYMAPGMRSSRGRVGTVAHAMSCRFQCAGMPPSWPLPNVWLGVSAEDQRRADERVPDLLATPAAVRFVSAEPLLGPIDFEAAWHGENALDSECWGECGWCEKGYPPLHNCQRGNGDWEKDRSGLDWVIVGGESGPGARPMHPDWARQIRDACASAEVAFHFKQHGAWAPLQADGGEWPTDSDTLIRLGWDGSRDPEGWPMQRVGKKAAGRLLDGVEHNGMLPSSNPIPHGKRDGGGL